MKSNVYTGFNDLVILQITKPMVISVASEDYTAQKLHKSTAAVDIVAGEQKPFVICEDQPVTLKVQTWKGDVITWKFSTDPYNMPLRKIFKDAANKVTATGVPITTIQIGY